MARSKVFPEFFAPYLPRLNSKKLMIPRALLESMNVIPKRVMLKDPIGKSWQVGMRNTYCGVYFLDGWEDFVKEISIQEGEFIVFKYNGDSSFGFRVYELSGCEKRYEEDCDEADDDDDDDDGDDDDDEDYDVDERDNYDNKDDDSGKVEEREDKRTYHADCSKKGTSVGTKPVEHDLDVENYVHYRNPFFVTQGYIHNRPHLFVPSRMIKKFKLNLHPGKKMILREQNPSRREWKEEVITWRDGRIMITGWHKFCKWNKVTKDDRCICEFTSVNSNVIDVHIVRRNVATN